MLVDAASGAATPVGAAGIFLGADPAPGGRHLLIERVVRPYSYLVPAYDFPQEVEIWNLGGERLVTVASIPLGDKVPVGGVQTGPRSFQWRPGEEATVVYVEALDGGNTRRPAEVRDRVVSLAAPFTSPVELGRLGYRYAGTMWGRDGLAIVMERDRDTRHMRAWRIDTNDPAASWRILIDRSTEDRYNDPGSPVTTTDAAGQRVVLQSDDGKWIYLEGSGASPEGDRPFLDRMNVENGKTERLWQSAADAYESVVEILDTRGRRVILRRETATTPPN